MLAHFFSSALYVKVALETRNQSGSIEDVASVGKRTSTMFAERLGGRVALIGKDLGCLCRGDDRCL